MAGVLTQSNPARGANPIPSRPVRFFHAGLSPMRKLVALALDGGPRFLSELQRAFDEGDAVLPVDLRLAPKARQRLLEAMRPAVVVTDDGTRQELPDPLPVEEGDVLVMATSGT